MDNGLFLFQKGYAKMLLEHFDMIEAKPKPTPMEPHHKLQKDEENLWCYFSVYEKSMDSDWAGDVNDRRSTIGYCFSMGSAAILWCSKKQPNAALSSTETEYCAAAMAA
ncbi:hypothetical protein BUALT_Bualt11G0055400 [Buddleja alternifolia]|uniref:Uncharacterized protein n=1 Tax=Buddleja alternifolia TaxID=168488 RepID=A0AAV6WT71_9LAMI|nr:hypothetical protein BUALT_Bualt11G0055400 [Buddleja alternifolia]